MILPQSMSRLFWNTIVNMDKLVKVQWQPTMDMDDGYDAMQKAKCVMRERNLQMCESCSLLFSPLAVGRNRGLSLQHSSADL